jgi:hypothetical protein
MRTKSGDSFEQSPVIIDEDGNRLEKQIGGGTKMKVAYEPYAYDGMGGGVTLRLKQVRVAPDGLVEYKSKSDVDWGDDCVDNIKDVPEPEAVIAGTVAASSEAIEDEDEDF